MSKTTSATPVGPRHSAVQSLKNTGNTSRRAFLKHVAAIGLAARTGTCVRLAHAQAETSAIRAIDVHAHMPLAKFGGPLAGRFATVPTGAEAEADGSAALARAVQQDSFDAVAALRIADMDRWGLEKTVVMPIDFGLGSDDDTHWDEAEALAEVCRKNASRLIPFFACDPRRSNALDLLDRAVRDFGMKGVKLHPLAGFAVDDRDACYAFYAMCSELAIPVLGHCRPIGVAARDDFARPERYERVAKDFPGLKICLGHLGGGPWSDDALRVIEQNANAYGDISTLQSLATDDADTFGKLLRRAMDGPARERVMYGSDWPTQRPLDAPFLHALRGRVQGAAGDPYLSEDETALLLRKNALRFLGLTPA